MLSFDQVIITGAAMERCKGRRDVQTAGLWNATVSSRGLNISAVKGDFGHRFAIQI